MNDSHFIYAIVLGIIQGISEFLPISSSGHLIIFSSLTKGESLPLALNVALHFGTLMAVLIYFWRDWLKIANQSAKFISHREKSFESHVLIPALVLGTIPAGVVGLLFKDQIETYFHSPVVVAIPLIVVGIVMVVCDKVFPSNKHMADVSIKTGILVGLAQAVALIPGTSRSGITIAAGRTLGFSKVDAAKFSFLLGTPAMAGAFILEASEIYKFLSQPEFYVGIVTSFVVGCMSIKFLLSFLSRFGFLGFAAYRVIVALIIIAM